MSEEGERVRTEHPGELALNVQGARVSKHWSRAVSRLICPFVCLYLLKAFGLETLSEDGGCRRASGVGIRLRPRGPLCVSPGSSAVNWWSLLHYRSHALTECSRWARCPSAITRMRIY